MSLPVHLVPSLADVTVGASVTLEGDEAHHVVAVRRMRVGERLVLTDGAGTSATAEVAATGKRVLAATVLDVRRVPEPAPAIVVVQALPKGERAAKSLAPLAVRGPEAAKQSRRSWFPVVDELATTADVAALLADTALAVVLHEEASLPLASLDLPAAGPLVVVVAPEGGLTDEEIAAFVAAGAASVRLGAEVLRTSTAGIAASGSGARPGCARGHDPRVRRPATWRSPSSPAPPSSRASPRPSATRPP